MTSSANTLFRERLLQDRAQLLLRIAHERGGVLSRAEVAADHYDGSFQSRAEVLTERQSEFARNEHETAELADIDAALKRIDQGRYGICTDCGVNIPVARLHAYPTAKRCIDCQGLHEKHR